MQGRAAVGRKAGTMRTERPPKGIGQGNAELRAVLWTGGVSLEVSTAIQARDKRDPKQSLGSGNDVRKQSQLDAVRDDRHTVKSRGCAHVRLSGAPWMGQHCFRPWGGAEDRGTGTGGDPPSTSRVSAAEQGMCRV